MNWEHVILAGYAGAVISIIAGFLRKKNKIGRLGAIVFTLTAIAVWNIVDIHYLRSLREPTAEQRYDTSTQNLPTYQLLKLQEPQLAEHIRTTVLSMIKEGRNEQDVIDFIQPQVLAVTRNRLQFAPDDQVIAVMRSNMAQTAAIQKISDDACFRYLYPETKGGINAAKLLPKRILTERMNTDVKMMRSAYGPNRHIVTNEEKLSAQHDAQLVVKILMSKYGQDIAILNEPHKGLGKEKIACEMVQDLWNNVMLLPERNAAGIIRLSMAEESQ